MRLSTPRTGVARTPSWVDAASAHAGRSATPSSAATRRWATTWSSVAKRRSGVEAGRGRTTQQVLAAPFAARDPPLCGQVGQLGRHHPRGGHHSQDRVLGQRFADQVAFHWRTVQGVSEHDRQVSRAIAHRDLSFGGLELDEPDIEARCPPQQRGEDRREQHGGRGRERCHPHSTGLQPGQRRDVLLGGLEPIRDRVGVPQHDPTSLGQRDATAGADDQRRAGG